MTIFVIQLSTSFHTYELTNLTNFTKRIRKFVRSTFNYPKKYPKNMSIKGVDFSGLYLFDYQIEYINYRT